MFVTSNKPPCKPTPLVIIVNDDISCKIQYINIIIAILLNSIDKSRLILTALLSKSKIIEVVSINEMCINRANIYYQY